MYIHLYTYKIYVIVTFKLQPEINKTSKKKKETLLKNCVIFNLIFSTH